MLSMSLDGMFVVPSPSAWITPSITISGSPPPNVLVRVRSWIETPLPGLPEAVFIATPGNFPCRFATAEPMLITWRSAGPTTPTVMGERAP